MPTYEYRCPAGHTFELFQRMSDPPAADCPDCGQAAQRLLSSGAGFLFKGDGFYITDYRSDSYKKAADAESGRTPGSTGGEGGAGAPAAAPAPAPSTPSSTSSTPSPKTGGDSSSGTSKGE